MKHQINETHLGTEATQADATRLAKILTGMGYPSEYSSAQGSTRRADENGETIEIPDAAWFAAMAKLPMAKAASALRAIKSETRSQASRQNGKKGGRPPRWFLDGEHWSVRALVRNAEGTISLGRAYIRFGKAGRMYDLMDEPTRMVDAGKTMGWGDLSGGDMVEIGGGITHRAWIEELIAKHG